MLGNVLYLFLIVNYLSEKEREKNVSRWFDTRTTHNNPTLHAMPMSKCGATSVNDRVFRHKIQKFIVISFLIGVWFHRRNSRVCAIHCVIGVDCDAVAISMTRERPNMFSSLQSLLLFVCYAFHYFTVFISARFSYELQSKLPLTLYRRTNHTTTDQLWQQRRAWRRRKSHKWQRRSAKCL